MTSLFDSMGVNADDIDENANGGPAAGTYDAVIAGAEMMDKLPWDDNGRGVKVKFAIPDYTFPKENIFALPSTPPPWDADEKNFKIFGQPATEKAYNENLMGNLKKFFLDIGIPSDAVNSVNIEDIVGLEVVLTLRERKGYVNYHKAVAKKNDSVLPEPTAGSGWGA